MPQLLLNSIIRPIGFTRGGWRHPDATPERALDLGYYQEIAATSERGLFDGLFIANSPVLDDEDWTTLFSPLEPLSLLSALAPTTSHIGLIGTVSSSFTDPYQIARQAATLAHLTGGRAGINVVVSGSADAARNFGHDELPAQHERYERADEYLSVVRQLWDSWGPDWLVVDKAAGIQSDRRNVRPIEHRGKHFAVRGPLDVPPPPGGRPLIFQAGSSDAGRELAATHADAVYSAAQTVGDAKAFRADIHRRQCRIRSQAPAVKILPGLIPIVGSTEAEAFRLRDEIAALNPPERAAAKLGERLDADLGGVDLDAPFPIDRLPSVDSLSGFRSFHEIVRRHADSGATLREVLAVTDSGNAHLRFVGTPEQVADRIAEWFAAGAADGFNINPAISPTGLTDFVDQVIPLLQEKGIYKREYAGTGVLAAFH
ncbi:NtaA/DmoA family FMN-dependent monooxygenase [Gordonia rubripertincta]|uniref:NtaA/DmoA family FMN-dependent monooxygenase n=1 Tax=Gordonia rubripertincta TaxID=36822 RepID=UPI000B8D2C5E|nr:NtaA/DmoA family FMN-dependent monooxygenase [Gordonia rubripertincta]ASR01687.1 Putative monooxygenase MoxC [Gordonia rubripertincta]